MAGPSFIQKTLKVKKKGREGIKPQIIEVGTKKGIFEAMRATSSLCKFYEVK